MIDDDGVLERPVVAGFQKWSRVVGRCTEQIKCPIKLVTRRFRNFPIPLWVPAFIPFGFSLSAHLGSCPIWCYPYLLASLSLFTHDALSCSCAKWQDSRVSIIHSAKLVFLFTHALNAGRTKHGACSSSFVHMWANTYETITLQHTVYYNW